jgi:hypothetical protein
LNDPKLIRLDKNVTLPPNLELGFFLCTSEQKVAALMYLFKFVIGEGQTIVFCATRHSAQFVKVFDFVAGVFFFFFFFFFVIFLWRKKKGSVGKIVVDRVWRCVWLDGARNAKAKCGTISKLEFASAHCDGCGCSRNRHSCSSNCAELRHASNAKGTLHRFLCAFFFFLNFEKVFVHRVGRVGRGNAQLDAKQRFYAYSIVSTMDVSHMCDVLLFLNKPLKNRCAK